jgi:hypothetical protein
LRFACDHVLFELFWVVLLAGMNVHVGHDGVLEVIV